MGERSKIVQSVIPKPLLKKHSSWTVGCILAMARFSDWCCSTIFGNGSSAALGALCLWACNSAAHDSGDLALVASSSAAALVVCHSQISAMQASEGSAVPSAWQHPQCNIHKSARPHPQCCKDHAEVDHNGFNATSIKCND